MPSTIDTNRLRGRHAGTRLVLSVLVVALAGTGSAFAAEAAGARHGDAVMVRPTSARGLDLRVGSGDGAAPSGRPMVGGEGSTIAALATSPMAPGEQRWGEFSVSSLGSGRALVSATIVTSERHGGRSARGCFRYRLDRADRSDSSALARAAAASYGGEAVRLLDGGAVGGTWRAGTTQRYRLTIRMDDGCAPRAGRAVSGSLVIRIQARTA